jgi:hypothetical protein
VNRRSQYRKVNSGAGVYIDPVSGAAFLKEQITSAMRLQKHWQKQRPDKTVYSAGAPPFMYANA